MDTVLDSQEVSHKMIILSIIIMGENGEEQVQADQETGCV